MIDKHIVKESIVGKSNSGRAVVSFDNETMARAWRSERPEHRLTFFKQITTEQEVNLDAN